MALPKREWCRECKDERDDLPFEEREAFEIKRAEFILWGKLLPPEALGPRCYDHAAKHVPDHALRPDSGWALYDLRPVYRMLDKLEKAAMYEKAQA